jgi:hypothetical protein
VTCLKPLDDNKWLEFEKKKLTGNFFIIAGIWIRTVRITWKFVSGKIIEAGGGPGTPKFVG